MSVIRVVARITPLNNASPNPPQLSVPAEFGNPISIETCLFTDPQTGLQYSVETTIISKKCDPSTNVPTELSAECERVPGFVCASPKRGFGEDRPTLSFPTTLPQETVSKLAVQPDRSQGLKVRFNLKTIEKERKLICARKRSQNLVKPLLRYFIEGECLICGFLAPQGANPADHLATHVRSKSYKCDCCSLPFANPRSLYLHKLNINGDSPYGCKVCGTFYRRKHLLTVHQLKNHTEQFCQFTQSDQSPVFRQNIPLCFSCSACGERLMSMDDVYLHIKYGCSQGQLHQGVQYADQGVRTSLQTGNGVQQTSQGVHTNLQTGNGVQHTNQGTNHEVHTNQKMQYTDQGGVRGILQTDQEVQYTDQGVHIDQAVQYTDQGLHGNGNHGESPSNQGVHKEGTKDQGVPGNQPTGYQCVFCGKSFSDVALIRQHTHVRVLAQKFACRVCAEEFGSQRALHQHQRAHVKDPWTCLVCGDNKKFYFEKTFLKHMRLIHGNS